MKKILFYTLCLFQISINCAEVNPIFNKDELAKQYPLLNQAVFCGHPFFELINNPDKYYNDCSSTRASEDITSDEKLYHVIDKIIFEIYLKDFDLEMSEIDEEKKIINDKNLNFDVFQELMRFINTNLKNKLAAERFEQLQNEARDKLFLLVNSTFGKIELQEMKNKPFALAWIEARTMQEKNRVLSYLKLAISKSLQSLTQQEKTKYLSELEMFIKRNRKLISEHTYGIIKEFIEQNKK